MTASMKRKIGFVLTLIVCIGVVLLAMAWLSGALRHDQISPGLKVADATPPDGEVVVVQAASRPR